MGKESITPPNAFSRLLKVMALERKQGYRNKAVIGGLDKFAGRWETDARAEASNPVAVNEIVSLLLGYPAVEDVAARERIIEQIARRAKEAVADRESAATAEAVPTGLAGESRQHEELGPARGAREFAPDRQQPRVTGEPMPPEVPQEYPTEAAPPREFAAASMAVPPALTEPQPDLRQAPDAVKERAVEPSLPSPSKPVISVAGESAPPRSMPAVSKPELPISGPAPRRRVEVPSSGLTPADVGPQPSHAGRPEGGLDALVTSLPGIGPSLTQRLAKLGVRTIHDLLYLLPRRYDDYSLLRTIDQLRYGEEVTIIGTVWDLKSRMIGDNRKMITGVVGDGTGEIEMIWFNPFVERRLRTGRAYTFSGRVDSYRGRTLIRNPEFEPLEKSQVHTGRLVPVYPLTEGISARWLRRTMKNAVDAWAADLRDFLPESVRRSAHLLPLGEALTQIHFPVNQERLDAAHRRLSFDEFFLLQLGLLGQRKRFREFPARPLRVDEEMLSSFLGSLPFEPTAAQRRALGEIAADLRDAQPMSRLLQGDVGSGKTAVAAAALWIAVTNGAQGAIMAPTEILAEQHARSFGSMFGRLVSPVTGQPVQIALFTGSMRRSERDAALAALAAGEIDIAVGTHALIQEDVVFHELALAVVDEQHRFGVAQRAALRQKGAVSGPHVLVMSATPIPRSLALTIYGDLDISVLDEMPAGRIPVKTKWLTSTQRERAYAFIRGQIQSGRQAFIIYPLVEETDQGESKAAVEEFERLRSTIFPALRLGLLHGRLKGEEKEAVMRAFGDGALDILVATSVVEVGIDVPNATVIMIEGAERFGLAQLHQFRGRVGRGEYLSYCILISDAADGKESAATSAGSQRLQALENTNDGFVLAQIDLDMRGPGDFFGTRQSGLPPLQTARLSDLRTLSTAREAAQGIFAADPNLSRPEHRALADQVATFWRRVGEVS